MTLNASKLMFVGLRQASKASRFFGLFKPSESIYWEPFDLSLLFKNVGSQRFEGGLCEFLIRAEKTRRPQSIELPPIEPNEVKTLTITDVAVFETGYNGVTQIIVKDKDGKRIACVTGGGETMVSDMVYPLHLATREEMYQKYAVVIALFFSVLASILTIVNVLVSILG